MKSITWFKFFTHWNLNYNDQVNLGALWNSVTANISQIHEFFLHPYISVIHLTKTFIDSLLYVKLGARYW